MSGKTTLGRKLSTVLEKPFFDTDHLIQDVYFQKTGNKFSCREIFQKEGDVIFRKLESEAIFSLKNVQDVVIAVGGGALMNPENVCCLKKLGKLIYLKVEPKILWERTKVCGVPVYLDPNDPEHAFYQMAEERSIHYASIADLIVD